MQCALSVVVASFTDFKPQNYTEVSHKHVKMLAQFDGLKVNSHRSIDEKVAVHQSMDAGAFGAMPLLLSSGCGPIARCWSGVHQYSCIPVLPCGLGRMAGLHQPRLLWHRIRVGRVVGARRCCLFRFPAYDLQCMSEHVDTA